MIDNLHATESGQIDNHPVWNQATSFAAWEMYLDGEPGRDASCYAAAARADDLALLPPAHICVGTEDLFYDEDVDYARRLNAAGVPCELVVLPGLYHAGDVFHPQARVSQRLMASVKLALAPGIGRGRRLSACALENSKSALSGQVAACQDLLRLGQ